MDMEGTGEGGGQVEVAGAEDGMKIFAKALAPKFEPQVGTNNICKNVTSTIRFISQADTAGVPKLHPPAKVKWTALPITLKISSILWVLILASFLLGQ